MSFEIRSEDVDVEQIMAAIRKRIEEKRQRLYTDEEIEQIASHRLQAVLDAHEFNSDFVADFRAEDARWNYRFDPETVYRSSRGAVVPGNSGPQFVAVPCISTRASSVYQSTRSESLRTIQVQPMSSAAVKSPWRISAGRKKYVPGHISP